MKQVIVTALGADQGSEHVREVYASSNGDTWHLVQDPATATCFVRHTANQSSGGHVVDISLPVFLSLGRDGPEHQELWRLIGSLIDEAPSVSAIA